MPIWAGGRRYAHLFGFEADCWSRTVRRPAWFGTLGSRDEEATILRSYVLIAGVIRGESGVISAEAVTGPYDVIVLVEAKDIDAVGQLVLTAIQSFEGIVRTLTCPVVNL